MNASQWHMNRLGLVDFWCYDNDEFEFSNGHMLLRGSNGSGKSVTMQSFIPLLLDGNKSSERLDPFGTRSRKMDTYLIDENSDRDERIGYLYLEFKRAESELYKTIGMGIRARKNKSLESWYFVIEDNRRVNKDFSLMNNHYTLSKKQLENILGNQVIYTQNEYMRKVNETLFGFANIDDYKEAIDLLLQLRSPKLSNSLSPSKINEILAKSLQPLSEEDLRPMSEAITNMDNLQDGLENLNNSFAAAKKISQAYDIYNKAILIDKWNKYARENELYIKLTSDIQKKEEMIQQKKERYSQIQEELSQNQVHLEILIQEKKILIDPQIERLHDELMNLKDSINELENQINQKENQYEIKDNKITDLRNDIEIYINNIYQKQSKYQRLMQSLDEIYEVFPFSEHSALKETLAKEEPFDFDYTKRCLKEELRKTHDIISMYQQYDQKQTQVLQLENEIIQNSAYQNQIQEKLDDAKREYMNCITDYQEYFYKFNSQNQILKLSDEDLVTMTNMLSDYELTQDYHSIYTLVHQRYMHQYEALTKERGIKQIELYKINDKYDATHQEYLSWMNKEDFEPVRDELIIQHRQYLDEHEIPYIPFFQLLNFQEDVEEHSRNKIEEILSQMHILDAIIVEKQYQEQILSLAYEGHDYYLWTSLSIDKFQSIQISNPFDTQQLISILDNLGIENERNFVVEDKYFHSGILEGIIDQSVEACFIGFERRKQLKQQKLDELSNQLTLLSSKQKSLQNQIQNIEDDLSILKEEMNSFKNEHDLKEKYNQIEKYQKDLLYLEEKINILIEQKEKESDQLQVIFQQIKQKCSYLMIEVSKEAVLYREETIGDYETQIDALKETIQQIDYYNKLKEIKQEELEELQDDIDTLKYEISNASQKKDINIGKVSSIQQQLDELGYSDKQRKLEMIEDEIKEIQFSISNNKDSLTRLETEERFNQEALEQYIQQQIEQENIKNQYQEILLQEVRYGFVFEEDEHLYKNLKQLSGQLKMNKSVSEYFGSLQSIFFEQASYLTQFRLEHGMDDLSYSLDDVQAHFIIKANHLGKKIPFHDLLTILQERIDSQKLLIMDQDRKIFEDILVNTIGKKIRNRIQASKRWVDKMERYMKDMNTSSGLQLGLKWRSKKALDDDELDTQKLVDLLEKDYRVLKESDRKKISQHFRSKIESARRLSLDDNTSASFHQLIKDVMDYRKWFEFTLYVNKPNENRKELTNRIFYAYSGGEKAIAMYVPLFSAVAAKFESAREDAPHLIALDEAFAGVDENNIDNLFALIAKFDFDYIMNSQVLWGDYPSCRSLAIYELFRPNNAPFVTKVAYKWNGHVKKVVMK